MRLQTSVAVSSEMAIDNTGTGYEDEAFESQDFDATRSSLECKLATDITAGTSDSRDAKQEEVEKKLDFAALLAAKYGDFYAITEEEETPALQPAIVETNGPCAGALTMEHLVSEEKEPPMVLHRLCHHLSRDAANTCVCCAQSPPPPPPPDDDEDDNILDEFTL
jgi:hypothetical protein